MIRSRGYAIWGGLALLFVAACHLFGWTLTSAEETKGVPRSVRDNPGSYRTHYFGGK